MKNLIIGIILLILAGAGKGLSDRINFHPKTMTEWSDWWQMDSWKNKWSLDSDKNPIVSDTDNGLLWVANAGRYYKERYWGSSRWFVMFTDGWHTCQFVYKWGMLIGAMLFYNAFYFLLYSYWGKNRFLKIQYWFYDHFWGFNLLAILIAAILVSVGFNLIYR